MTREYIGARYVPKFDGVHDINKSYEPLTIVTDARSTTSYTSKKLVPVGISLNNEEYWAITGTLSGAVLDIQERLSLLENEVVNLEEEYPNRTFFLFGDSLFDGYDPTSTERKGWGYWLNEFLTNKGYKVHLATDITTTPYGSAFAGDKTYVMHLNASLAAHPEYLEENITDIIVYTGSNDATHSISDTESGMSQFVQAVKAHWPNANIKIGYFSGNHNSNGRAVDSLFREKCGKYGCTYIKNGYGLINHANLMSNDGVHLITAGYAFYSPYLCEGALSGNLHYSFKWSDLAITPRNPALTFSDVGFNIEIIDNKIKFKLSNIGSNVGHISVAGLSGANPAHLGADFENPTLLNLASVQATGERIPLYDNSTGNLLGILQYTLGGFGGSPNAGNIPFQVYGSVSPSTCEIYAGNIYECVLN